MYLARDTELNRDVALKQIQEEFAGDSQSRARFVLEAEITGSLEHPGVVPVYGNGTYDDGRPYYAMQFVRGDNLKVAADRFHQDETLSANPVARSAEFQKLLRRFVVVCETMAYAHTRGVIHRDLKPKNILLGPFGETLVVDWGLAKVIGHSDVEPPSDLTLRPPSNSEIEPTTAGMRMGTAAFMSPEQARGDVQQIGVATDIYGLGATLYYVLTGRAPFADRDLAVLFGKVERGEFPPPRAVNRGISRALDAICRKAMALEAHDRYGSARELADDLDCWMTDQPVSAYKEPILGVAWRAILRRRQLVGFAAALLILSVVGLSWHAWRISGENAKTEAALQKSSELLSLTRVAVGEQSDQAGRTLASIEKTEQLRLKLARNVVEVYRRLLATYPDDPDIRFEAGERFRILASLLRLTGQLEAAVENYQRSIDLFQSLFGGPRRNADARRAIIEALTERGELHRMNSKTAPALKDYDAAQRHAQYLEGDRDSVSYKRLVASISINLSSVMIVSDKQADAARHADDAISLLDSVPLEKLRPDEANFIRYLLALACVTRAISAHEAGDRGSTRASCERTITEAKGVPADSATYSIAQCMLAFALMYRAEAISTEPALGVEAAACIDEALLSRDRSPTGMRICRIFERCSPKFLAVGAASSSAPEGSRKPTRITELLWKRSKSSKPQLRKTQVLRVCSATRKVPGQEFSA